MDNYKAHLWVKTDPFLVGTLQLPPPGKFSMHYLRKMSIYVRTRSVGGCYPRLCWVMWRHIACGKMQLEEDTAWMYFEVFHCMIERSTAQKSLKWANTASSCTSVQEYEEVKSKFLFVSVTGSTKRAIVACNSYRVPHGHRMVVMSLIYRQTLAKSSETLVEPRIKIHRCNECYIYLLSPLRCVPIEKCQNSTIILGPVQTTVHVQMCDNVKVICLCQRLPISSTTSCSFHILSPARPLIVSGNQGVILATFHTHYPMLEDHMGHTGLATVPNYWDRPLILSTENIDNIWKLMSPREFYTFVVPFEMEGDTTEIPGGLPAAFQQAMWQRQQKVQTWQKTVKEAALKREQRKQFQMHVEQKFNEWLIQTGNRHQLDSLVPPSDVAKQAAGYKYSILVAFKDWGIVNLTFFYK